MKPGPKPIDPTIRFWSKVQKGLPDQCWIWTAGKQGKGYGQFYRAKREPIGAHRYSWELANGRPVPAGMQVMHSCDNPPCVNPAHLSVGTCADNLRDCADKGRNPGNRTKDRSYVRTKWAPEIVKAMRDQGMTYREIGDALNISPATALRTLRRL